MSRICCVLMRLVSADEAVSIATAESRNLDGGRLFCHVKRQSDGGNPAGINHDAGYVNRVKARLW